jgi:hypothetical protein
MLFALTDGTATAVGVAEAGGVALEPAARTSIISSTGIGRLKK